ncbi:hypothetical protein ACMA5I_15630 [Paracoccaceae bacterium GXU_MW_L88]
MENNIELQKVEEGQQLNGEEQQRLVDLCAILDIPIERTTPNPAAALVALVHLFALPCVEDEEEFDEFGNAILDYIDDYFVFPERWHGLHPRKRTQNRPHDMGDGAFYNSVKHRINQMDWFPWMFFELRKSPEELADLFETLAWIAVALKILGGAAGLDAATSFGAGVGQGFEKKSVRAGIERAAQSLIGQNAFSRGILSRLGKSPFSPVSIALAVGGAAAYMIVIDMMEDIREVIEYRFQSGEVSDEIYNRVFGEFHFDAADINKYGPWEGI